MFYKCLFPFILASLACAYEGFETLPVGALQSAPTTYGTLTAAAGQVSVLNKHARSGKQALHIQGGEMNAALLSLSEPLKEDAHISLWVQRWTANGKFDFRLLAIGPHGVQELQKVNTLQTGGYLREVQCVVPSGTTALRMECSSEGGVLVDDVQLHVGPMRVVAASCIHPGAQPILKRAPINPILCYRITTAGASSPIVPGAIKLRFSPANAVKKVTIRTGKPDRTVDGTIGLKFRQGRVYGEATPGADGCVSISCSAPLVPGENELWVDVTPSDLVQVGDSVTCEATGLELDGKDVATNKTLVTQRVGYLLAVPDAKVQNPKRGNELRDCVTYRIPGMIRSQSGALIACFDARYENHLDLSADIDVAVVRSEDGGKTWTEPTVAMDAGPGKGNGCGDPCILQDKKTGRIWLQALATHFDRNPCLLRSRTGFEPQDTGQWEMVYSDDDGKTWSRHINITREIKHPQWTTILAGPGCGICTSQGVLVFPAQIWDLKARPSCMSTICYSEDGGKTWHYGNGVPHRTSECQVAELQDGSLMLTCRNETFQGKRVIYTTRDLGKTWQPHPTNTNTLNDPACQASLVAVESARYGRVLLYSHPNSKPKLRNHMTIRASLDEGKTWNEGVVYDARECWGYSCIALIDDETVGIIYEPSHVSETNDYHGMGFLRIPLAEILSTTAASQAP